ATGVKRHVGAVAGGVGRQFSQVRQFPGQRSPQSGMAAQEGLVQAQQGVSSCHDSPPLEVGRLRRYYSQERRHTKHSGDSSPGGEAHGGYLSVRSILQVAEQNDKSTDSTKPSDHSTQSGCQSLADSNEF